MAIKTLKKKESFGSNLKFKEINEFTEHLKSKFQLFYNLNELKLKIYIHFH